MDWRHGWYLPDYRGAVVRQGLCRLQVAVRAAGLLSHVTISTGALVSADARPVLCDVLLPPDMFCRADGRWVGWEWIQDSGQSASVSVRLDGQVYQYSVPALPESESGLVAQEQVQSALHTGVWFERREIRVVGLYPDGGFLLDDVGEREVLAGARCDGYAVTLADGRLRLHSLASLQELTSGTPVDAAVVLMLFRHGL